MLLPEALYDAEVAKLKKREDCRWCSEISGSSSMVAVLGAECQLPQQAH